MKVSSWVLIFLGGLLMGVGVWLLSTAYLSTTWPVVEGRLVKSEVAGRFVRPGDALRRTIEYYIRVEYEYMVDRELYRASRYSLGTGDTIESGFFDKSEARSWLKQSPYQVNQPIHIYVDPNDPNNTVLSAGIRWSTWVPIWLGLLFIGLGWLIRRLAEFAEKNKTAAAQEWQQS